MEFIDKPNQSRGRRKGQSTSEIQCVSYLSTESLLWHLRGRVKAGIIGHFWAVEHEPDEDSKKPHHHVRMTPPIGRSVDWSEICQSIAEVVPGEALPRKLVVSARAVNNQSEEGLLYARHEAHYLRVKGLTKAKLDYPREAFYTDSEEWLDEQWSAADAYEPKPKKMTTDDLLELIDSGLPVSRVALLRLCLSSGLNEGQWRMLCQYQNEVEAEKRRVSKKGENQP